MGSTWIDDGKRLQVAPLVGFAWSTPALRADSGWFPIAGTTCVTAYRDM